MKPYNILFAQKFSSPGGSQVSLLHHLETLERERFIPRVVVSREGWLTNRLSELGIPWDIMPFGHWTSLWSVPDNLFLILSLIRYIRRYSIDLVHANEHWVAPQCLLAARLAGIPVVCHFRTGLEDLTACRIRKYLLPYYDKVIVVADVLKRRIDSHNPELKRIIVIRDGVKTSVNQPRSLSHRGRKLAVVIGRIYDVKGQALILEKAVPWLKGNKRNFLLFVGDLKKDEAYVSRMRDIIADNGLQRQVLLLGIRHDTDRLLDLADVLIAYSSVEGVPMVVMEAMLAGRPVIVSNTRGMEEVVEDGITGKIIDYGRDGNPLYEALQDLELNYSKWESMGKSGRIKALRRYSILAMSNEIQLIYNVSLGEEHAKKVRQ